MTSIDLTYSEILFLDNWLYEDIIAQALNKKLTEENRRYRRVIYAKVSQAKVNMLNERLERQARSDIIGNGQ